MRRGALHEREHPHHHHLLVAPFLTVAATDARHFYALSDCVYRFMPVRMTREDLAQYLRNTTRQAAAPDAPGRPHPARDQGAELSGGRPDACPDWSAQNWRSPMIPMTWRLDSASPVLLEKETCLTQLSRAGCDNPGKFHLFS